MLIQKYLEKNDKLSTFAIERSTKGLIQGKKEKKLGMRASETCEVILNECAIPYENMIGEEGKGKYQALSILDGGRISIAALSLGISISCLKKAINYSKERYQFGRAISSFQAISFKLADMFVEKEASYLLCIEAAKLADKKEDIKKIASSAKLYCSEKAMKIVNETLQIFGGYGYIEDFPIEKYYRDCRLMTIGEGTSEIQRLNISKEILKN